MALDFNWVVIFLLCIAFCAYFSYREGHKKGVEEGVEHTLDNLMSDKIIHIDEERGEIEQWDRYYDQERTGKLPKRN